MLPLEPRLKNVTGSTDRARRAVIEHNAMATNVVEHLHRLIANNPESLQQYFWANVAQQMSLSVDEVAQAVMHGGHNGITIAVHKSDQPFLSRYR